MPALSRSLAIEPGRLRRGLQRGVLKLGPREYRVEGRHQRYYDVGLDGDPQCYCKDSEHTGMQCLHILAARLHDGDSKVIMAVGELLLKAENNLKEMLDDTDDE